jgi:hypothetical protein
MKTVHIEGLGLGFELYSETLQMSGTVKVQTTGSFIRVNHIHATAAGTHGGNVGDVRTHHGPLLLSLMVSGSGHDSNGIYTIPSGSVGYVRSLYCNTGKDATVRWRVAFREVSGALHTVRDIENYRSHQRFDLPMVPVLPAGTDLIISAQLTAGAAATVTAGVMLHLVTDLAGTR